MIKKSTVLIMILLFSNFLVAQNNYEILWKKVQKLELENLPKSALKVVDEIYSKAEKEKNAPQLIKTLFYKSKFSLILEEDAQLKIINEFKTQIKKSKTPTKNVLENALANLYWQYFKRHRWKFYNRTKTERKVDKNDFRTWDLQTLFAEVDEHYNASLQNGLVLQQTDIKEFSEILHLVKGSEKYRPTLFDFLAHNALAFYKTNETNITKPTYQFKIDNPVYLKNAKAFSELELKTKDKTSLPFNALKIYQQLILQHLNQNNLNALADVDIERLKFVAKNATFKNTDDLLLKTLQTSLSKYKNNPIASLYAYEIASIFNKKANYKEEENRFKNKNAIELCNTYITNFPNSDGAIKCKQLVTKIKKPSLSITAEKHIPIQKNSRLLITYKNTNKLYFTAYKISKKQYISYQQLYKNSTRIAFINRLKKTENWENTLRNENDNLQHNTEVVTPKFNAGVYLIVASESKSLDHNNTFGTALLQVTNLALVEVSSNKTYKYQVVDRNTGSPIKNATVKISNNKKSRYSKPINITLVSDNNGFVSHKSRHTHHGVSIVVSTKEDKAYFGNYYFYKQTSYKPDNNDEEEIRIKPFLFTDRSIYRPGQTVYFKTIFIQKKDKTSELLTNEYVEVTITNPNGQKVTSLDLKLNEYGAISGEFILPNNGLTGEYNFEFDESSKQNSKFYNTADFYFEDYYDTSISVEEYKRPKFKTEFKPITKTFKLNDSITVNGFAKAFSGTNITNGKVVYKVKRNVQYPNWWYWYRPYVSSEPQEITHGETTTDAKGNFKITFKALPDESVSQKDLPIFTYEITADVTDINGETRSANTLVKVGYHALTASINMAEKLNTKESHTISINTKNLNNQPINAKGILKIYKLKAPKYPLRKRPWNAPDYQDISEVDFRNYFPNDPYTEEEGEEKNWKKGELVFETSFNTEKSKEIKLKNIKKWNLGKYIAILETEDRFKQKVKAESRFSVVSSTSKVADNKLFFYHLNQSTYKVGDNVNLQIGSASNNITVVIQVEKKHTVVNTQLIYLNNEVKNIKIPVTKEDIGGFAIKYHFVNYNSFSSGNIPITVPHPKENINIEIATFRDKLQPGIEQTWRFTIKNDKKNSVAAQLLASMYDASLDEFKPHNWSFNPIKQPIYYSYDKPTANHSFGKSHFRVHTKKYPSIYFPTKSYHQLNWFGFSFTKDRWIQHKYLAEIKQKNNVKTSGKYNGTITGVVWDDTGALPGVSISIKGSNKGTETDFDGNFSIKANKGDVLQFSFVGLNTVEKKVENFSTMRITMYSSGESLDEIVVTGYGKQKRGNAKMALEGKAVGSEVAESADMANLKIRGIASANGNEKPLYIVDGVAMPYFEVKESNVISISMLKDAAATALYGNRGKNGVIIVTTKTGQAKLNEELANVKARKNLQETAFFYPNLTTDKKGNVSFNFTTPEALTRWKLQLLAYTKNLQSTTKTLYAITQKELMVSPNVPRFLRQGDKITISTKISNLANKTLDGVATLILNDVITGKKINAKLNNLNANKNFSVNKNGNTTISWNLIIPEDVQAVQYKIIAKSGSFSDGEQSILPVLSNRMLVTETLPMWVGSNQTKTFSLNKLVNQQQQTTLKHHKLTLEVTSNPAWYAIQSLPYLMEYPHECAEQVFSRYYANTLASYISNSNPRIKEVFNAWKTSDALVSNLEKNKELKSLLIQETPWLRDAQSETQQKKRIALLFDLNKMRNQQQKAIQKLKDIQMANGGFPWFKGSRYPNIFITQHIASGFGHLKKLGITKLDRDTKKMLRKAISFLDDELANNYKKLLKNAKKVTAEQGKRKYEEYLAKKHIGYFELQYLYMRSFYNDISIPKKTKEAVTYYKKQSATYWNDFNLYGKGLIAIIKYRDEDKVTATKIINSLKENSITSEELGMYWKANKASWYWYQSPVETQALLIEAFSEIENDNKTIDNLKIWLLKNKQVNRWKTTKATTEAVYALLLQGSDWISVTDMVDVKIGNKALNPSKIDNVKIEAGTGYFKNTWNGSEINKNMGKVTLTKKGKGIAWGGLYWQYFENLNKITSAKTPLSLRKKIFLKVNTDKGKELKKVTNNTALKVGDLLTIRIELRTDRDIEFVHMKDMRASGVEPINVLSQYKWQDGLGYYESTKDAATNFFFDRLPKGVYVFEYDVRINNAGNFSNGITSIQSMYAPEFSSHSEGVRININ